MKKIIFAVALASLFAACNKTDVSVVKLEKTDPTSLNQLIFSKLETEGKFNWEWASDDQIWTALNNSDYVLSVGYQPKDFTDLEKQIHKIDFKSETWMNVRKQLLQQIWAEEQKMTPNLKVEDLTVYEVMRLPVLNIRISNPATITMLRNNPLVRYAEPIGYEPHTANVPDRNSGSICSNEPETNLLSGYDYFPIAPGCKRGWNFSYHKIPEAWNNSTGSGVEVTIIDTGASDDQDNLGSEFSQGYSNRGGINKLVTLPPSLFGPPETPNDGCGHGTQCAGVCAAPRGTDGASVGIAYNADLTTIRAAEDVILNTSREVTGVTNAFVVAGNSSTKIISMSMGRLTTSNQIKDAVIMSYNNGKMIFCAAGTSTWATGGFYGVIFPAWLTQAIAITGVQSNLNTRCSTCHDGSKVDFVMVMERVAGYRHSLTLDKDSNDPSTVGGSSTATASIAGIAALVWGKNPSWNRTQVFNKMKTSSSFASNRHGSFGWGIVNAQTATN